MDSKTNDLNKGNTNMESRVKDTFELLKKGETEIPLSDKYRDFILVLGNTGCGKSTFVQWIAGDNEKLISREVKEGLGDYVINDQKRISNSTIESKTTFPELQIEAQTNTAFYDCPGFSDTRNTDLDIASTYFIKKVIDHAKSLKIIFLISHPSVRKGVDRQDFMTLMKHASDLLKNIDKYKNSIAIIATKVDNSYVKREDSIKLVSDEIVIGAIGDFLLEVEQNLKTKLEQPSIPLKEQEFYRKTIKLIKILLTKENSVHINIGIFRRPDRSGPVSRIPLLQEGKKKINNIIQKQLRFTVVDNNDFGYTISEKSKNEIHDLVEEINRNVWSSGRNITEKVNLYYRGLVKQVQSEIKLLITSPYSFKFDELKAQTFSSKFSSGKKTFSSLVEELKNKSIEEMGIKMNTTITSLGIKVPKTDILPIENAGKYFNFLKLVSEKDLNTKQWGELFKDLLIYFSESKNDIHNDAQEVARHINKVLNDSRKTILTYFDEIMKVLEIQKLPEELNKALTVMKELKLKVEKPIPPSELLQEIEKIDFSIKGLGVDISKSNLLVIVNQNIYLKLLQDVSGTNLISEMLPWSCPFEHVVDYLSQSLKWYKYLNGMYSVLSDYKVQENPSRYNVGDLDDWGKDEKPQGIVILKSNFQKFLEKSAEFSVIESNNIKNINVTESQLEELNNVFNLALRQKIIVQCEGEHVFIMGEYIKIQDIIEKKNDKKNCWGSSTHGKFKFINVFALNTIFMKKDLSFPELELSVTIIAPKWEVIGSREIDLHGSRGGSGYDPNAETTWDSICSGLNGRDGVPGSPGGPGGSFFGIAGRIINGNYLTINTSGGNGGSGSDGKDGICGSNGTLAVEPGKNTPCPDFCKDRSDCKKISYNVQRYAFPPDIVTTHTYVYEIIGKPGAIGGKGGDGGRGGEGGKAGDIDIVELDNSSGVLIRKNSGNRGKNGVGGKGGKGGRNGGNLEMTCILDRTNSLGYVYDEIRWKKNKIIEGADLGTREGGSDGANTKGMKSPESPNVIRPTTIINKYKQYLRKNTNNRLRKYPLNNFLNRMDSNKNIISMYDTLALVEELQGLEAQFHNLLSVDLLPFYDSLLKRVSEYAKRSDKGQNSLEQRKILSYLYTGILGRIQNYKDNIDSNLIIYVTEYLDRIKEDFDDLKELQNTKKKHDVIKKYRTQYEDKLFAKVEEAKNFIEKDILPELEKVGNEIGSMVEALINEVKESTEATEAQQKDLIEKREKLKNLVGLHGLFGVLNIFGQALNILGPWGMVAGGIVSVGSSLGDSTVLLSEDNPDIRVLKLPKGVTDLEAIKVQIKNIRNDKLEKFKKLLGSMSEEIEKDTESFGEVATKITDINDKLTKTSEKEFSFKDFKEIEKSKKELQEALKARETELKAFQQTTKTRNTIIAIDKFKKSVEFTATIAETYIRYKNQQEKLNEMDRAITESGNKIQQLKEYEQSIYTNIAPMLQNLIYSINDIQPKLNSKSQVALEISKWQVQKTLNDMKVQMEQLTEGFKSQRNLIRSIDKLNEAMTTLISVYDHIQDFQEQQTFAIYIADISSAAADSIDISNEELRDAVRKLEITVRSSIILERYKVAVDAFKQYVFPFAHTYFKDIQLPTHLRLQKEDKNDLENFIQKARTQIDHIKTKHKNYKLTITSLDQHIGTGDFNSNYQASKPFFTWKKEFHKNMTSQLLSGHEVVVYADIADSGPDKDAIKFNVIDLQFKAKNNTMQSKINKVLKGFKISATHLGNSYYRYNGKIYLISTNSQPIWYSFEKNDNNEPVHRGEVYDKIKDGEFMLSPYATWKIKIENATDNISFDDLKIFADEIDLELGGRGRYVNNGKNNKVEPNVDKYYNAIETLGENEIGKGTSSTKNKREVNQLSENSIQSMHEGILEVQFHATNSAVHISSSINSLFNWFKKRSRALLSSIVPTDILDDVKPVTENDNFYSSVEASGWEPIIQGEFCNDNDYYEKPKGFVEAVVKDKDFQPEKTLDTEAFESTPIENKNAFRKTTPNHHTTEYESDYHLDNAPLLDINEMKNYTFSIRDQESNNSNLLLPAGEKINNSQVLQSLEGWGSLMLADVMMRSITKEKYEQNCLVASSPILEKNIELYHLEQKVRKGLQKMSFLFGDQEVEEVEFSPQEGVMGW